MTTCTAGGLFDTQADINRAISALREQGFREAAFTIIGREGGAVRGEPPRKSRLEPLTKVFRTGGSDRLRRTLTEMGCSPEEAHYYTRGVKDGRLLILVHNIQPENLERAYLILRSRRKVAAQPHQRAAMTI
jgi:hypothetical protein